MEPGLQANVLTITPRRPLGKRFTILTTNSNIVKGMTPYSWTFWSCSPSLPTFCWSHYSSLQTMEYNCL